MTLPAPLVFVLPDLGLGGAQRVMLRFASGLDMMGFDVRVLVLGGSQALSGDAPERLRVERGDAERLRNRLVWLLRRLRALRPAVVMSAMGYVNLALLAMRPLLPRTTRLIVREANAVEATLAALPAILPGRLLYNVLYRRADAIIAPTRSLSGDIAEAVPAAASRIVHCPNPTDVADLRRCAQPVDRTPGTGLRIVAAGRLTRQKGFDRLLPLLAKMPPDTRLRIFGDGPDRPALTRLAAEGGVKNKVEFCGVSNRLPAAIAGADVLALPSRWEGLPNVALEALALGTPVVVSDEVQLDDLALDAPPGALCAVPVGEAFANALLRHNGRNARAELSPGLLPLTYDADAACARLAEIIQATIADRNAAALAIP